MRIINIKTIFLFIGLGLLISCGGGSDTPKANLPGTPALTLPIDQETCTDYTVVSSNSAKAQIKGISFEEVANVTTQNAKRIFKI